MKTLTTSIKNILTGYAKIYFSDKWYVGLLFFAATCIVPLQGLAGFLGMIFSNLFAKLINLPEEHIREGYYAYNGLLTALALGLTYSFNTAFILMLLLSSAIGVLIAAVARNISDRYLFIPVLSLPFVLTTWLVIAAGQKFSFLVYSTSSYQVTTLNGVFPEYIEYVLRSLGAAFFQLNIPAGILVAAGLLIFSRQAFILAVCGIISGTLFYTALGGSLKDLQHSWIGFNFALTAIAAGGMFVVPSAGSFLLALFAAATSALIAAGASFLFAPLGMPLLAFPFIASTLFLLYALKIRHSNNSLTTILYPRATPEENLKAVKLSKSRYIRSDIPAFELPLSGAWTVTQGVNGSVTHKGLWSHAWDFELFDSDNRKFRTDGGTKEDFYAWDMPVFAPADGKVVKVIAHLEDNRIGMTDEKNNWGNTIVIWHYGSVYTSLSHLKKDSVLVKEGELITKGQPLAKVGNSGRSPVPHVHFQVQYSFQVGAPTAFSEILNYLCITGGTSRYITHGVPQEGDTIQALEHNRALHDCASFPLGRQWVFEVAGEGRKHLETWETEIDFSGSRYLVCREKKARLKIYTDPKVFMLLEYEGADDSALFWLYAALPRMPFSVNGITWEDELPGELFHNSVVRELFNLLEPYYPITKIITKSRFIETDTDIRVHTVISQKGLFTAGRADKLELETTFFCPVGLTSIAVTRDGKRILTITQRLET